MELLSKTCTRCREDKPLDTEHFPPHKNTRSGFDSWCRACRRDYRNRNCRGKFRDVISDEALTELKASVCECVICGSEESLVVDHDHSTGQIRGLLCQRCNLGIGHFRDDPLLLEFAAQYLYASTDHPAWTEYLRKWTR